MSRLPCLLCILAGCIFSFLPVMSQEITFNQATLPDDEVGVVLGIDQDAKGYLWMATQNGLFKFDGVQYTAFHTRAGDPNSLSLEACESVLADDHGYIWVGHHHSSAGLDRLDPATGIFTHYRNDPNDPTSLAGDSTDVLYKAKDGTVWIGTTKGLDRYDRKTNLFIHYANNPNDPGSLSNNQVRIIYEDMQGTIWVGTGDPFTGENPGKMGGLNKLDLKTGKFTRYLHKEGDSTSLADDRIRAIFEDSKGNFWVGSAGDGLHKMDRGKGLFERLPYNPGKPGSLSRPPLANGIVYADDHITFITEDVIGRLWIGTYEGGINVYDPKTKGLSHYGTANTSATKLAENNFWLAFTSRDNMIWISTWGSTLYKVNPYQFKVPFTVAGTIVNSFHEDEADNLWIASNNGLLKKRGSEKEHRYLINSNPASDSNTMVHLERIDNDRLWVCTRHGLYIFNTQTNVFSSFATEYPNAAVRVPDSIYAVKKTSDNTLWVGSYYGLLSIQNKTGAVQQYRSDPHDSTSISNNIIRTMLEDSKGNFWVTTNNGLNRLDRQSGHFKRFLPQSRIYQVYEDKAGVIWAATDKGLYKFEPKSDYFSPSAILSMVQNVTQPVYWMQEDVQQNLWLNAAKGVLLVNKNREQVILFGKNQGIYTVELNLEAYLRKNGEVLYGSTSGYYSFNNQLHQENKSKPIVIINQFLLNDSALQPAPNGILTLPVDQTKEIRLGHQQNSFSFEFSSIDYVSAKEDMRLLYMLEHYDNNWRLANDSRLAYYFNLPPGEYVFKVKAYSSNGLWDEQQIAVVVLPPWYTTWWAWCIWGLLFATLAFAVHRAQKARVIKAEQEKNRAKELAQAKEIEKAYHELRTTQSQLVQSEKMASLGELTAGIAHEIQNPLNFVNNFADINTELIDELQTELKAGNTPGALSISNNIKDNEQKISHHGKRADSIVKGMLQHSRNSTGKKEPVDINALADEYLRLSYHGLRAKDNSFNAKMTTDFDARIGTIQIVPQDIGRVLLNLYTNAFYAVTEKKARHPEHFEPEVSVSTKKEGEKVIITVKDNGNGISQKIMDKIFQPFFTTKPTGQGTGLGLSLSYDIIKAHGGELEVKTKEGEGSEFLVYLPLS